MDAFQDLFQQVIIPALITLLTAAVTAATGMAIAWIQRKSEQVKSEYARSIINRAAEAVQRAVQATNQTFADDLRLASADGKLTKEEAAQAFSRARSTAMRLMGDELRIELERILGGSDQVSGWMSGQIEAAVGFEKPNLAYRVLHSGSAGLARSLEDIKRQEAEWDEKQNEKQNQDATNQDVA